MTPIAWTDERTAKLRQLYAEGRSYAEIAKRLGGVTRNAVCGKVDRMNLAERPNAETRRLSNLPAKVAAEAFAVSGGRTCPRPAPVPAPPERTRPAGGAPLVDLEALGPHACRWPFGTPGEPGFGFCAGLRADGETYCPTHRRIAYRPSSAEQKARDRALSKFAARAG